VQPTFDNALNQSRVSSHECWRYFRFIIGGACGTVTNRVAESRRFCPSASGTTALLESVTTPISAPEVVVWAGSSFEKTARKKNEKTVSRIALNFIVPRYEFQMGPLPSAVLLQNARVPVWPLM